MDSHEKTLKYIDGVIRAHSQAGLTLTIGHFHTVRLLLTEQPKEPPQPLSMVAEMSDHDFQADMVRRVLKAAS